MRLNSKGLSMATEFGQLNIRIEESLKKSFILKARENDTTATDLIIAFMKRYLSGSAEPLSDVASLEARLKETEDRLEKLEGYFLGELAA